ncbi:MAG: hypothetical protein ACYSWP_20430 [Planctomycetota bacterium]|jgi:hypothetical protein
MRKRIKITLLPGWIDYSSENPEGPATYLRDASEVPGAFQVSLAEHIGREIPNPSLEDFVELASKTGETTGATEVIETVSGECRFGRFGSAVMRSKEYSRIQVWYLSEGYDFILATHICTENPDQTELAEVQEIVKELVLVERPWWKFW